MKRKYFLVMLCLLIIILSVGIVSAHDNSTTSTVNDVSNSVDNNNFVDMDKNVNNDIRQDKVNNKANAQVSSELVVNDTKVSKKSMGSVKGDYYDYDEDEEYGFNEGSYVDLSYEKIKTNQYNISARIINSYNNPVKAGEITVYVYMGKNQYPTKTLTFKNGRASYIQKFHTTGNVKIFSSNWYRVSYLPVNSDDTRLYRNSIKVTSDILSFKVCSAEVIAKVPKKCDVDEKVDVKVYTYDDDVSSDKGTVSIYVDDKFVKSKKVVDGCASFSLNFKKVGKHVIEANYKTNYGETFYDTGVVEITRKKEKIILSLPKSGGTSEQIVLNTKVTNDTDKLSKGYVYFKSNGKNIGKARVKNGETTSIYRLPYYSDTFTITAEYVVNNKTLTSDSKEITSYDYETLTYDPIKAATTDKKIVFNATVTNPYVTVNYGTIRVIIDDEVLLNKVVKNDKVSQSIKIPNMAGTYNLRVIYLKKNNVIIEKKNVIVITNSEKISYNFEKKLLPDTKYTFRVKVTSPNVIVNNGEVMFKLGSKTVTSKVKNGIASISIKTTDKEQNVTASVSYVKYQNVVDKKTGQIQLYYPYKVYVYPPWDTIKGSNIKISSYVYTKNGNRANSGKVIFYINKKKIGTASVKYGEAVISYKANLKPGIYKVSSVFFDKNNRKVAKEDMDYMTIVNKLTNDKNLKVKTLTPSYDYSDNSKLSIGSSEYLNSWYYSSDSGYDAYVSLTNKNNYYPVYNRLIKARFYYVSNGKVVTKVYGDSNIVLLYMLQTENENAPYKVEVAYRAMNSREKKYMKELFTSYH